jgi:hypothetical protein
LQCAEIGSDIEKVFHVLNVFIKMLQFTIQFK